MSEIFTFDDGNQRHEVRLRRDENNRFFVSIGDKEVQVNAKVLGSGQFQFTLNNMVYKVSVSKDGDTRFIHLDGEDYLIKRVSDLEEEFDTDDEEGGLVSPMPGRIVKVFVKPGETISKGQDLISIEAMKMENRISAPNDGVVKEIFYAVGDQVEANIPLIEIEELTTEESESS
ncbi:MAG: biotin/lipoyl-containing protein [Candidatus Hodarchaeales archaeon]